MCHQSKLLMRESDRDHQCRGVLGQRLRLHATGQRHACQRVGDDARHAELLLEHRADAVDRCAAAGQHDLIDLAVFAAGVEELQQAADLLHQRFLERLQRFGSRTIPASRPCAWHGRLPHRKGRSGA